MRIEQYDNGEVIYVTLNPDGIWERSEFPDEILTVDYDKNGVPIGVEVIGVSAL